MFEIYPMNLDMEIERRQEVIRSTMLASRGERRTPPRVPGVNRVRHVVIALAGVLSLGARTLAR
jgi:hypothetical protein